jgi:hypothetical protein
MLFSSDITKLVAYFDYLFLNPYLVITAVMLTFHNLGS